MGGAGACAFSCVAGWRVVDDSAEAGRSIAGALVFLTSSEESESDDSSSESSSESEAHLTSSSCSVAAAPVG